MKIETAVALGSLFIAAGVMLMQFWKFVKEKNIGDRDSRMYAIKAVAERDSLVVSSTQGALVIMQEAIQQLSRDRAEAESENTRLRAENSKLRVEIELLKERFDGKS